MRLSVRAFSILGFAAAVAGGSCGGGSKNTVGNNPMEEETGGSTGSTGGKTGSTGGKTGSTGGAGGATGGSSGMGGSGGATGGMGGATGGMGGATGGMGGATGGMGGATGGMGGAVTDWMGYTGVRDLSQVEATAGCGKAPMDITPGTWKAFEISNIPVPTGQRDNAGDGTRKYFVRLPPGYMPDKKYKLVIAASSCTGGNQNLAAMGDVPMVTDATGGAVLISPVVEPGVWDPDQCYDDKDPNSIENPFLERFLDQVGEKYCYDKNRVFVQGHSSGGWYSNMIGFTWAAERIRGFSSNGGGLPDNTAERPKINNKPMAGLWIHPTGDTEQPMAARRAVSRALVINKCMGAGTNPMDESVYMKAPGAPWAMGGAQGCKKYECPEAFPVIFCQPPGGHQNLSWHTDAAWALFNGLP